MSELKQESEQPEETEQQASPQKGNPIVAALIVVGLITVALLVVKFISDRNIPEVPGVALSDIHSIEDLRSRFNQDYGSPRVILLLSPT